VEPVCVRRKRAFEPSRCVRTLEVRFRSGITKRQSKREGSDFALGSHVVPIRSRETSKRCHDPAWSTRKEPRTGHGRFLRCPMTPTPTDFRPCGSARCNAGYASGLAMMRNDSSRHRLRGCLPPDSVGPLLAGIRVFADVCGAERPSVACSCRLWRRTAVCALGFALLR